MVLSTVVSFGLVEGAVRLADGGALPWPAIYVPGPGGRPVPAAHVQAEVLSPAGEVRTLRLGAHGLREPVPPRPAWLAVGDSQVLGLGVEDEESFCARATRQGLPMANAGVPAYGLGDALARAAALVDELDPAGVIVFLNQANDWAEGLRPVTERMALSGGRLVRRDAVAGWRARLLAGPLGRSHLVFWATLATALPSEPEAPAWLVAPTDEAALTRALVDQVREFGAAHPGLDLRLAWLPLELSTSAERLELTPLPTPLPDGVAPWTDRVLRDQVREAAGSALPLIDLQPVLDGHPEAWLPRDIHLSPEGHRLVAQALVEALRPAPAGGVE